jgi:hypothetical protein
VVDDLAEGLKADSTFTDVSVEQTNSNNNVRKLTKLCNLLRNGERDERTETSSGEYRLESSCNFTLNGVLDRWCQLDLGVVSNDVLLILVQ